MPVPLIAILGVCGAGTALCHTLRGALHFYRGVRDKVEIHGTCVDVNRVLGREVIRPEMFQQQLVFTEEAPPVLEDLINQKREEWRF